jgi:hypothetical protein
MIQDKIFFDEKDPTGLSYNTPFTVFGSYQGRLWSKAPGGEIRYYTQNSDLSVYARTGSNQFNGNQTVTGSLTVTGGITGTATTASYVQYSNVANKPTLVSGSAQVSFTGIINKPTLVSGSSQITYSGISSIPAGIVSSSVQVRGYNVFATTGSNQFNGSQSVTGSLTVTGQVIAQTLNVQEVTSSIVFSSGSNRFGNSLGNTQQFTGSVSVTGSLGVNSSITVTGDGSTNMFRAVRSGTTRVVVKNGVNTLGINTDTINNPLTVNGGADFSGNVGIGETNPTYKLSIVNAGASTFLGISNQGNSTGNRQLRLGFGGNGADTFASIQGTRLNVADDVNIVMQSSGGNVGIGTNSPSSRLSIAGAKTNSADLTNAANQLTITDTTATAAGVGGRISFLGSYTATPDYITFGAIEVLKDNANNYGSASWNNAAMRFIVGNNDNDANAGRMLERMRITSGGNVGIGTASPSYLLDAVSNQNASTILSVSNSTSNTAAYAAIRIGSSNNVWLYNFSDSYTTSGRFAAGTFLIDSSATNGVNINAANGSLSLSTSNNKILTITSGGNVEVGKSLNSTLLIENNGTFSGGSGAGSIIRLNYGGQTIARIANTGTGQRDSVFQLSDEGTVRVNISANNSRGGNTYFNGGGNVGINTSNPTKLLHVSGGGAVLRVGPDYVAENGSADRDYIDLIADGSNTKIISPNETFSVLNPSGNIDIISQGSGGVRLTPGATSWTGISDLRLKNINSEITNATAKLNTLRAVNFSWKSDETQRENLGLIAQDVEAVFPQIVDTDKDGLMGVRYTELIPVLVKALQELKSENDNLKYILQRNNIS